MKQELETAEKSQQFLDMMELKGGEMFRIMRRSGVSARELGGRYGRTGECVRKVYAHFYVKSCWRDRLRETVGDEMYFGELLRIREAEGTANNALRDHVAALMELRRKRPVQPIEQ